MTWSIKTVKLDIPTYTATWTGSAWNEVSEGTFDYVINFNRDFESTWRRVEYVNVSRVGTNRENVSVERVLTGQDFRYQFLNPQTQDVDIILPNPAVPGVRYFIKNLTSTIDKYKLHIKETSGGTDILVLDEVFTTAFFVWDGVEYQGIFG